MKLRDALDIANDIRPNAFGDRTKTAWLNEIEGRLQTDVYLIGASEDVVQYDYALDQDRELMVKPPHDKLYPAYIVAMIDYANGEYDRYANSMVMFNSHWEEYIRWLGRNTQAWRKAVRHEE